MDEFFAAISNSLTPPIYRYFDGGNWLESKSGKTINVISPIDSQVLGELQSVTQSEIDEVMQKAKETQAAWEAKALNERVKIMHLAADYIRHYEEYLTNLLVSEIGKTHDEAKSEVKRTADLTDFFADEAASLHGEIVDSDNFPGFEKGKLALIGRVAHGVVLAIAPFNYPINLSASKIVPALLMGNSVVFKPPSQGGISALHLARIFEKAGVPAGVFAVVTGSGAEIGDYLVGHPAISMITFTGNSDTALNIASKSHMVPLLFECGGSNPAIVFPDADLGLAVREIIKGAFAYSGQRCTGIRWVGATASTLNQLQPLLLEELNKSVKMGDPRSPETKLVGPLISETIAENIEQTIKEAVSEGAVVVVGGKRDKAYLEPTILTNVKPTMKVITTEIFGPVLSLVEANNLADFVGVINNSRYGLQASVFTKDEGAGIAFAQQLKVGTVQINGSPQRGPDHFPFLGVRGSGVGVQGVRYSLESMSRLRPIVLNKPG